MIIFQLQITNLGIKRSWELNFVCLLLKKLSILIIDLTQMYIVASLMQKVPLTVLTTKNCLISYFGAEYPLYTFAFYCIGTVTNNCVSNGGKLSLAFSVFQMECARDQYFLLICSTFILMI